MRAFCVCGQTHGHRQGCDSRQGISVRAYGDGVTHILDANRVNREIAMIYLGLDIRKKESFVAGIHGGPCMLMSEL